MHSKLIVPALAAAAAFLAAPAQTHAQAHTQQPSATASHASRIVATFDFGPSRRAIAFPAIVTVSDSAGALVASARLVGTRTEVPMQITVLDSDLVLQGETPDGVLTLVLDKQNEGGQSRVASGRWSLGNAEGMLRGRSRE